MLVIFYVDVITCQIFNLPHTYHILEMKNLKLVTWYPNMVHIMSNDMVQYTFNFYKN
jgi:hypothetical protein